MNTKQVQYALALSEILNFSRTAEYLGITQPALSKQIAHLEEDLGIALFDRNPLAVTPAGAYFLKEARKLLYREGQLLHSLKEFKSGKRGKLVIGISPFRCLYLMPPLVKKLQQQFPYVQIQLCETGSDQLRKDAAEGKYDLAVVNLPVDESALNVIPIEADTLMLAVPKAMAGQLNVQNPSFKDCKDLPFVVLGQPQEMRHLFDQLCITEDVHPRIAAEVVGLASAWAMVRAGVGATLLPLQFAQNFDCQEVVLFPLDQNLRSRQPVIVTRRGQYLSEYAQYAIRLLTQGER